MSSVAGRAAKRARRRSADHARYDSDDYRQLHRLQQQAFRRRQRIERSLAADAALALPMQCHRAFNAGFAAGVDVESAASDEEGESGDTDEDEYGQFENSDLAESDDESEVEQRWGQDRALDVFTYVIQTENHTKTALGISRALYCRLQTLVAPHLAKTRYDGGERQRVYSNPRVCDSLQLFVALYWLHNVRERRRPI